MHISAEGKIGIALGLLGLGGAGAVWVVPEQLWIGWNLLALAASGGIALTVHHFHPDLSERKGFVLVLIGTSLIISGSVLGLVGAFQMDTKKVPQKPPVDLTKNEGVLEPGNLPTPPIRAGVSIPDDAFAVFAGGGVHWTQGASFKVFRMAGEDMLGIERRGTALVVTVLRIYNAYGSIIARLDEDGF
jgi:hypothetical protein